MKISDSNPLLWIFLALAAVLLAPYAGIHIITSPAPPFEPINTTSATGSLEPDGQDEAPQLGNQPTQFDQTESLQDIEGLLEEE